MISNVYDIFTKRKIEPKLTDQQRELQAILHNKFDGFLFIGIEEDMTSYLTLAVPDGIVAEVLTDLFLEFADQLDPRYPIANNNEREA